MYRGRGKYEASFGPHVSSTLMWHWLWYIPVMKPEDFIQRQPGLHSLFQTVYFFGNTNIANMIDLQHVVAVAH